MSSNRTTWGNRHSDYRIHQHLAPALPPETKSIRQNSRTGPRSWTRAIDAFTCLWVHNPHGQISERPSEEILSDNDLDDHSDTLESSCLLEQSVNLSAGQDFITALTNELQAVGDMPSASARKAKVITFSFPVP